MEEKIPYGIPQLHPLGKRKFVINVDDEFTLNFLDTYHWNEVFPKNQNIACILRRYWRDERRYQEPVPIEFLYEKLREEFQFGVNKNGKRDFSIMGIFFLSLVNSTYLSLFIPYWHYLFPMCLFLYNNLLSIENLTLVHCIVSFALNRLKRFFVSVRITLGEFTVRHFDAHIFDFLYHTLQAFYVCYNMRRIENKRLDIVIS